MNHRFNGNAAVEPEPGEVRPFHMMWFMGQLFMIPVAAMVYGVELLVRTMQGMQKVTARGLDVVVGRGPDPPAEIMAEPVRDAVSDAQLRTVDDPHKEFVSGATPQKEEKTLSNEGGVIALDKDLHDDMLKLVRYKLLFVKREYEYAFPEQEDLVSDNMDGSAFTAWKVAEFIQQLAKGKTDVPAKWGERYPSENREHYVKDGKLVAFPDHDKKYLRVYYEVLDRYPREKFKYEEQQIEVLKEIRDKIK